MPMPAELVEVVIGVDTHEDTHTAAVLDTGTGGVPARMTVPADPDGYAELVAPADQHSGLRAWAMEGTGGYGAGTAPTPASSGKTVRYRLNRSGDRQLDRALHTVLPPATRRTHPRLRRPPPGRGRTDRESNAASSAASPASSTDASTHHR